MYSWKHRSFLSARGPAAKPRWGYTTRCVLGSFPAVVSGVVIRKAGKKRPTPSKGRGLTIPDSHNRERVRVPEKRNCICAPVTVRRDIVMLMAHGAWSTIGAYGQSSWRWAWSGQPVRLLLCGLYVSPDWGDCECVLPRMSIASLCRFSGTIYHLFSRSLTHPLGAVIKTFIRFHPRVQLPLLSPMSFRWGNSFSR